MAKSGYKDFTVANYINLRFSWSAGTPNIANNFTPVNWTLSLISTNSTARISSSASKGYNVTFDGSYADGTNTVGINGGATKILASGSKNVYHNADGTRTFTYSFNQIFDITYSGSRIDTISGSGSGELDPIPRGSILGSISNFTIGSNITIPITKYSSSFSDTLNIYVGDTWIKRIEGLTNNQIVTFTTAELNNIYKAMSNVASANFRFVNSTYSGASIIGTSTKNATGTINTNIKPSISNVTVQEIVFDIETQFGALIQNKSKLGVTISAVAGSGSSIDTYEVLINGSKYVSSAFTTEVLTTSGTNNYSVTVKDKRGRSASTSGTFEVTPYTSPTISNLNVVRCDVNGNLNDGGNYAKVTGNASITSLSSKNTKNFKLQYKLKNATEWTTAETFTNDYTYTPNKIISGISADNIYEFRILAIDFFGEVPSKIITLSSGYTILDIKADGKGLAFGGVSSKNLYQFYNDIYDKFETRIGNGLSFYEYAGQTDPDTTIEELILTAVNIPKIAGFYYVRTMFYSTKSETANRTQIAYPYNNKGGIFYRYYINGTGWSKWEASDIIRMEISDGAGILHFANGTLIQWGRVNITPTAANTVTSVKINFPVAYDYLPRVFAMPNTSVPNLLTSGVGGGTTIEEGKVSMMIYMTRTNTVSTTYQWDAKGYKAVI